MNGIDATRNGKTLVIVQRQHGAALHRGTLPPASLEVIDLGGMLLRNGDGILLHGKRLYVVQNFDNQIAVVRLAANWRSGVVVRRITDPRFHVPTTIDRFGPFLYAVNARFPPPPQTPDHDLHGRSRPRLTRARCPHGLRTPRVVRARP